MSRKKLRYILLFIGLLTLLIPMSALADAAPPGVPDGMNINPGEESTTMVQMVAEEVDITVQKTLVPYKSIEYAVNDYEGYRIDYDCIFWMENKGEETENLSVRFPIVNFYFDTMTINIQAIKVNGRSVTWTEDEIDYDKRFLWAYFDVEFPPGEEIIIQVLYTAVSSGWLWDPQHRLNYVLATGAGWYGPIGTGKITIHFPYQPASEFVFPTQPTVGEWVFSETDLVWEFTDLEPTGYDDIYVSFVTPDVCLNIIQLRNKLLSDPTNPSTLFDLAQQIADLDIDRGGGVYSESLLYEGIDAIKTAIEVDPENFDFHDLYLYYLWAEGSMESQQQILEEIEIVRTLISNPGGYSYQRENALHILHQYQTETARANATATVKAGATKTAVALLTTTPTPTATSTPKPTSTSTPPQPPAPTVTPTPTPVPDDSSGSITIIAVVVILVLVGAGTVWAFRRE